MALRFVYFADPDTNVLINKLANPFCAQKGLGMGTSNRVVNVPEVRWNDDLKTYWISITVDVKAEAKPLSEQAKTEQREMYQEGGVTFNVMTDDERKEIERLEEEKKVATST